MVIQWFPGHMAKARTQVQEKLKFVDFVIEVVDARMPLSSRNPMLDRIIGDKPRLVILNKADLAEETNEWLTYFKNSLAMNAKEPISTKRILKAAKELLADKIEHNKERGIQNIVLRTMVVGIPNSGKSTLLNTLAGKASAKTGNTAGVTKSQQWIRSNKELEIIDTPGILWPKFEDQTVGLKLALTGAIKDNIYTQDDVCIYGLSYFAENHPDRLEKLYGVLPGESIPDYIIELTAKFGYKDAYERFYNRFIIDVRNGKLGRFCLDRVEDASNN
ncbi:ribosome biogenesis GTPase YlqF [Lactovum miscens]|uniref:Ribosome biogenesis GTPase A n=1 Tax=Lactovum miscens TaxID=190387 RepID=A0A841CAG6_9LACT|nr:ribosome biogenesis GTPase YlqF [Lactovum miscens]MBB5888708.1 ribosome biogenesis GTPase A [Lactovum miscens]